MKLVFGNRDEEREAERQIMHIKQTGSVLDYATRFRGLMATLRWGDGVAIPVFREGLKPGIKWEIRKEIKNIDKLKDVFDAAIQADNEYHDFKESRPWSDRFIKTGKQGKYAPNQSKPRQPNYRPMPMDLDVAQKDRKNSTPKKFQKRGKLT